ncbi:polysaccharide deacetylase family protein [Chitinophaga lutea]|nr:polysaccharide deacetylase family protein [Chitinophaga lutea]
MDSGAFFFIMTVTIGKKGYLSAREINALHQQGHTIGSHTWDHPRIQGEDSLPDANRQLRQSKATLEKITGAPVTCLAYPFGSWNEATVSQLQKAGFHLAFQLSSRRASRLPQYTIRRIMVDGRWQGQRLLAAIRQSF